MLKTIHNVETGEITTREMTTEEIGNYEWSMNHHQQKVAEREAKEAERQQILARLGLTEEESKLLLS